MSQVTMSQVTWKESVSSFDNVNEKLIKRGPFKLFCSKINGTMYVGWKKVDQESRVTSIFIQTRANFMSLKTTDNFNRAVITGGADNQITINVSSTQEITTDIVNQ